MSILLNIDKKIDEVETNRNKTEADLEAAFDAFKGIIKDGNKIEESIIDIFKNYTKIIRDLNKELNYLYQYKGEATNK